MANTKISELSAAATLDGTEEFAVVQSAATVKATVADLLSDDDPAGLGEAASGTGVEASRDDHVHPATITANTQTASYTLAASDAGKAVEMDVASANNLTVPPNSSVAFPTGTVIEVCQIGAGQTTIVADTGVTVNTPETLVMTGQWSTVSLRKRSTDGWVLAGDVEASA